MMVRWAKVSLAAASLLAMNMCLYAWLATQYSFRIPCDNSFSCALLLSSRHWPNTLLILDGLCFFTAGVWLSEPSRGWVILRLIGPFSAALCALCSAGFLLLETRLNLACPWINLLAGISLLQIAGSIWLYFRSRGEVSAQVLGRFGKVLFPLASGLTLAATYFATTASRPDQPWDDRIKALPAAVFQPPYALARGSGRSRITYVVFIDLQCLPCRDAVQTLLLLHSRFGWRVVVRQHPLASHERSDELALWLAKATVSGHGWQALAILESERTFEEKVAQAARLSEGMDRSQIQQAQDEIDQDMELVHFLNLRATPAIFVIDQAGKVRRLRATEFFKEMKRLTVSNQASGRGVVSSGPRP